MPEYADLEPYRRAIEPSRGTWLKWLLLVR